MLKNSNPGDYENILEWGWLDHKCIEMAKLSASKIVHVAWTLLCFIVASNWHDW